MNPVIYEPVFCNAYALAGSLILAEKVRWWCEYEKAERSYPNTDCFDVQVCSTIIWKEYLSFKSSFLSSYLLVGAAIFDALESDNEDRLRNQYKATERTMLAAHNISPLEYQELEDIVIKYQPHKGGAQWKFPGAFYFSLTVITTIGKIFSFSHTFAQISSHTNENIWWIYFNRIFMC